MSGHNAQRSLPPSDRDDAPLLAPLVPPPAPPHMPALQRRYPGPILTSALDSERVMKMECALFEAMRDLGFFQLARMTGDWRGAEATIRRLAETLTELGPQARIVRRAVAEARPKETATTTTKE